MTAATAKAQIFTTEDTEAHRLYREILVISFLLAWPQTWEISVVEFPFALLPESAPAPPARFAAQPAVCGSSPALARRCGRAARRRLGPARARSRFRCSGPARPTTFRNARAECGSPECWPRPWSQRC